MRAFITPLISFICICLNPAAAEELDPQNADHLQLKISQPKARFVSCEPVPLEIQVINVSEQEHTVVTLLEPRNGSLTFKIVGPGDIEQKYNTFVQASLVGPPPTRLLKPRESVLHREILIYSGDWGFHFKEPGQYSIQATYDYAVSQTDRVSLASNVLKLTVTSAGKFNAKALEHFYGFPQGKFAIGATDAYAVAEEFQKIVDRYPDSDYAPWSYYFLGRAWQSQADHDEDQKRQFGSKDFNPSFPKRAVQTYQTLLEKHPKFPLATEVQYQIAKETMRMGEPKEGLDRIRYLTKQHPNLHLLQKVQRTMESLRAEGIEVTGSNLP